MYKPIAGSTTETAGHKVQDPVIRLITGGMHVFPALPLTASDFNA